MMSNLVATFEYSDRKMLGNLQLVCSQFNTIVQHYFPTKPYHILSNIKLNFELDNKGQLQFGFLRFKNLIPSNKRKLTRFELKSLNQQCGEAVLHNLNSGQWCIEATANALEELHRFCGPTIRFLYTTIRVSNQECTLDHIKAITTFSHLWRDQTLSLTLPSDAIPRTSQPSYFLSWIHSLFNTPNILKCRELLISGFINVAPMHIYSNLYKLDQIKIVDWNALDVKKITDLVECKGCHPQSNTTFFIWNGYNPSLVDDLRKSFLDASTPSPFQLVFRLRYPYGTSGIEESRMVNQKTKEVMLMRQSTPGEALKYNNNENVHESIRFWILSRSLQKQ
ncbi:hypothetical protein DdX_09600 [Ditylenchus destructor]|uniref:F-box domain-containing protein n=1 Tax=Ditylenchus destructor TaxID=166010 RepID=A0AAD4R670_9BILA|nr:hypothetical protein DdX_09600 [Ditylenchus destructor]